MPKMLTKIMRLLLRDAGRRKNKSNERARLSKRDCAQIGIGRVSDADAEGVSEVPGMHKALIAGRQSHRQR